MTRAMGRAADIKKSGATKRSPRIYCNILFFAQADGLLQLKGQVGKVVSITLSQPGGE